MKRNLKKTLWIGLAVLIGAYLFSLLFQNPADNVEITSPDKAKVAEIMKTEPSVKDFVLTDANVLYIAVADNGDNRNGLAEYFCQQLKDNQISVNWVKIVRYGSQNDPNKDNAYGILIGESTCN